MALPARGVGSGHPAARARVRARGNGGQGGKGAVLALVGPEYAMGKAFLALQGAKNFTLQVHVAEQPRFLFNTPLQSVVRLDRDDLNRWLMDQTGSVSYIPYIGAILLMPYDWDILTKFDQVATGFVPEEVIGVGNEEAGHIQMAEYAPEVVYVAKIDRPRLISGWDIPGSLARVEGGQPRSAPRRDRERAGCRRRSSPASRSTRTTPARSATTTRSSAPPTSSWTAPPKCCSRACRTSRG